MPDCNAHRRRIGIESASLINATQPKSHEEQALWNYGLILTN